MPEDERDEDVGQEPEAGQPEEIDIELGEPEAGGRRRGFSVVTIVVVIAVGALVVWYLFWAAEQTRTRQAEAQQMRQQTYKAQLRKIGRDLNAAIEATEQGDTGAAIKGLADVSERIQRVGQAAMASGDTETARVIQLSRKVAADVAEEAAAKHAELMELLSEKLRRIQRDLGVTPRPKPEPELEEGEAKETEEAVEGGEAKPEAQAEAGPSPTPQPGPPPPKPGP